MWGLTIKKVFTLPMPYKSSMPSNLLYQTPMTVMYTDYLVMYVEFPRTFVTLSPDWPRDFNWINTTEYDWPGLYYTRLGQTTINSNGTSLHTTAIIHLAPSWHSSPQIIFTWLITCATRAPASQIIGRRRLARRGKSCGVKWITSGTSSTH